MSTTENSLPPVPDEVKQVFSALSWEDRVVLLLRYADGLTEPEIAVVLRMPLSHVSCRRQNALNRLQRSLLTAVRHTELVVGHRRYEAYGRAKSA